MVFLGSGFHGDPGFPRSGPGVVGLVDLCCFGGSDCSFGGLLEHFEVLMVTHYLLLANDLPVWLLYVWF